MKTAYALVDYDNIRLVRNEFHLDHMEHSLGFIREAVSKLCKKIDSAEIVVRIYGGWIDEEGNYTKRASLLLRCLNSYRGVVNSVRVRFELAETIIAKKVGLVCLFNSKSNEQKMVDTMIAVDAIFLHSDYNVIIMSNDEDVIPPVFALKKHQSDSISVLVRRDLKKQYNTQLLRDHGVLVEET